MPGDPNWTDAVTDPSAALWDAPLVTHRNSKHCLLQTMFEVHAALVNYRNSLNIYCLLQTMFSIFEIH